MPSHHHDTPEPVLRAVRPGQASDLLLAYARACTSAARAEHALTALDEPTKTTITLNPSIDNTGTPVLHLELTSTPRAGPVSINITNPPGPL